MGEFQEESGEETEVVAGGSHQSLTLEDLIQEVSELRQRVQGNTKTLTKLKSETDAVEKLAEDIQEEMKAVHKETASLRNGLKDVTELKSRATTNEVAISGLRDETQNLWKETGALKDVLMLQGRVGGYVY
ncbi:hypothetical protein BaRGS_00031112 [Batillaria attramentaria]|uniref:Uncharacterized protein n=1 Tax=Batillaria attramentaria TaxID=370345 RepID=A0ABD0JRK5_9CAEN